MLLSFIAFLLGITDKFSHPSSHICTVLSSSTNPRRSTATPAVYLLAEPSKSQVRRTQTIGQRLVCENVPRMQVRSAPHDWLTLTAAEPSKSQVRRTQAIGQRLVCENVPRMQARSASHDWLTLTAIDTAHLCKSGRPHLISASFILYDERPISASARIGAEKEK